MSKNIIALVLLFVLAMMASCNHHEFGCGGIGGLRPWHGIGGGIGGHRPWTGIGGHRPFGSIGWRWEQHDSEYPVNLKMFYIALL